MSLFPGNTEYIFIVLNIDGGGGGKYTREIEFYLHLFYAKRERVQEVGDCYKTSPATTIPCLLLFFAIRFSSPWQYHSYR